MTKIVVSSGHRKDTGSGASGILNEVTEARKVVKQLVKYLKELGATVYEFHDDTSKTQAENLNTIVKYHNSKARDLDISVHFNAGGGEGSEVLHYGYKTKDDAAKLSKVIADALDIKDRGPKERPNLAFLKTEEKALLLEICFVDSKGDAEKYNKNFDKMCRAIAEHLTGKKLKVEAPAKEVVLNVGTKYQVIAGTFETKENADKMAASLKKAGFDAYVK